MSYKVCMNEFDVMVNKVDETRVKIFCKKDLVFNEMKEYFSARPANYRFMPMYKSGMWDGKVQFIKGTYLPIGLLEKLEMFCQRGGYTLSINFNDRNELSKDDLLKFIQHLELPYQVRDFQFEAVYQALTQKRISIESVTGSGKSLVAYIICRFLILQKKRILLIVPTTQLVEQMYQDFIDYGFENIWEDTAKIYSGKDKNFSKQLIISTWQSLHTMKNKDVFSTFDCLIIDEAHGAKGTSITKIASLCYTAEYRVGLSGTFPDYNTVEWFSIVGSLGPIRKFTNYQELIENKYITDVHIKCLTIEYSNLDKERNYDMNSKDYVGENDYVYTHERRNKFVTNLAYNLKQNTIILFTKIDHGNYLYDILEKHNVSNGNKKKLFYIDGNVATLDREDIRSAMEKTNDIILLASYGTFSAGINLKNLHNIIFGSNYKSKIKVLQSIGRGVRNNEGKDHVNVFDIVDNLNYDKYVCYGMKHEKERIKIYNKVGFTNIERKDIKLY